MYVDESGDGGLVNSPTPFFCLSGLVIHESKWHDFNQSTREFRQYIRNTYGIRMRDEIHANELLRKSYLRADGTQLQKHLRLFVLRDYIRFLSQIDYVRITNIVINKVGKAPEYDVFTEAWKLLIQRFENTLKYRNFPGSSNQDSYESGLIFCDNTDGRKLTSLTRKLSVYNPVPSLGNMGSRQIPIRQIIEDPVYKDSKSSYFIQAADVCAYMLYQYHSPNSYIRKKAGKGYFEQLSPILNLHASRTGRNGIVMV